MVAAEIIAIIKNKYQDFNPLSVSRDHPDELTVKVSPQFFKGACLSLHEGISSAVMMLFASDERKEKAAFEINSVFVDLKRSCWVIVAMDVPEQDPSFDSLARSMYSASLFERQIYEMFGIKPKGNPDLRRLILHDEVCPQGNYPLRKDFKKIQPGQTSEYEFSRVEGDGVFEVPVGPVHAGIIGSGHFRFSVAGEPIINLEARLGFTHKGIEKLFEEKNCLDAVCFSERVSGDSVFAHSLAFTHAAEKIAKINIPPKAQLLRGIFLELERMYNHVNDIGGIALDAGFSFPSAYASIIKEAILQLNFKLCQNRYLRKVNTVGGVLIDIDKNKKQALLEALKIIEKDFNELEKILFSSVSFMDRVDTTGILRKKTAQDLGISGLAARASGIHFDLRKFFPGIYKEAQFKMIIQESGDALARLKVRISEFKESIRLIGEFCKQLPEAGEIKSNGEIKQGSALGYTEGWRGPVLYWIKTDASGIIQRAKIVDPSFLNWQGLSFAVLGNIIPDFPLCNKSFDLSYSGNDL